ncbi:MAG: CoA pyrophosphatase [Geobacter sp.]|nr:CoA pyrophosphatase [Geobacter sp.]
MSSLTIEHIIRSISGRQPLLLPPSGPTRSAVAMILKESTLGLETLFILRAKNDRDPWSGNIAFPGGHVEAADHSPRMTAERETREETGLVLEPSNYLGQMDDIAGAHLPVLVSCFVYHIPHSPSLTLNHEISRAFWLPLVSLLEPRRHAMAEVVFGSERFARPALTILGPGEPLLWGITYRLVAQFLELVGQPLCEPK